MPPPGLLWIRRWPAACKDSPGHERITLHGIMANAFTIFFSSRNAFFPDELFSAVIHLPLK